MQGYSLGCFTCRRRKVKCDERKPGCLRCERRGEDCPGYRDRSEIVFRDMNDSAAAMAGHGVTYYRLEARGEASAQSVSGRQRTSDPLTLVRLSSDWEGQALTRFFHDYILLPSADRRGYLEFLPDLCVQNWRDGALREALLAASMASFANISDLGQVRTAALRHYGLALQSVRETLNDPVLAKSNSFLASIILLQKFEIISGNGASSIGPHDEALANLQDQRSVHDLMSPLSQSLSFAIQSRLYISELDGKRPNSSPVQHSMVRTQVPHHAALWQLFGSTARVCRRMRHLIASARQNARSNAAIQSVFQQMFATHGELATWPMSVSEKDEFRSIPAKDIQGIDSEFPQVYLIFDSVQHCALWMSYWSIRLQFLEHMRSFISFIETFSAGSAAIPYSGVHLLDQLSSEQTLIVDNICGSSPYMLGDIGEDGKRRIGSNSKALGAFFLLRGLYVAMHIDNASAVQIDYMLDRLVQIGRSKGVAQALRGRLHWLAAHPEYSVTI